MAKKLYRVKVVLYVMAENESDACVAATKAEFDIFECAARKAERIDPGWHNAVPYNSSDGRTCAEIFNQSTAPHALPASIEMALSRLVSSQEYPTSRQI